MNRLEDYHRISTELMIYLEKQPLTEERDQYISYVNSMLIDRQKLIKQIIPPYTQEEQIIGKSVLLLEQRIEKLMLQRKLEVGTDIAKLIQSKKTTKVYGNSYQTPNIDGMYYDKRN